MALLPPSESQLYIWEFRAEIRILLERSPELLDWLIRNFAIVTTGKSSNSHMKALSDELYSKNDKRASPILQKLLPHLEASGQNLANESSQLINALTHTSYSEGIFITQFNREISTLIKISHLAHLTKDITDKSSYSHMEALFDVLYGDDKRASHILLKKLLPHLETRGQNLANKSFQLINALTPDERRRCCNLHRGKEMAQNKLHDSMQLGKSVVDSIQCENISCVSANESSTDASPSSGVEPKEDSHEWHFREQKVLSDDENGTSAAKTKEFKAIHSSVGNIPDVRGAPNYAAGRLSGFFGP